MLGKISGDHLDEKGYTYLYQYKSWKGDVNWKIATAGLVPASGNSVEMIPSSDSKYTDENFDFTGFTAVQIDDDKSLASQLKKLVRQMLNTKHKSAAAFYETDTDYMQN